MTIKWQRIPIGKIAFTLQKDKNGEEESPLWKSVLLELLTTQDGQRLLTGTLLSLWQIAGSIRQIPGALRRIENLLQK